LAVGLIDKLTNFLMPVEDDGSFGEKMRVNDRRTQLKVHGTAALRFFVVNPREFDDVRVCSDYLQANMAVLLNFAGTDDYVMQRICDFLAGVSFVTGGTNQRVSDTVMLYVPAHVDISKELYAYSAPSYLKRKLEL